jgi:fructose-specific phosphotransferase system IIA component
MYFKCIKEGLGKVFMSVFARDLIKINYYALDKKSCLTEMTEFLFEQGVIKSQSGFLKDILERESLMSTGIGRKIAIPHTRSKEVTQLKIAVYLLDNELEFDSIDGELVKIIFMIAVPEEMKEMYMKVLSVISNYFRDDEKRNSMLLCNSKDELCKLLKEIDDEI